MIIVLVEMAIVRYFQMWPGLTWEKFKRALALNDNALMLSFAGKIGSLNAHRAIRKSPTGWMAIDQRRIYPSIPKLPEGGVSLARIFAKQYNDDKRQRVEAGVVGR